MNNVVKSETLFAPVVRGKNALCFESACILIVGAHNSGKKSLQLALKAVMHEIYTWLGKFNAYDFKGLKDKLHFSIGSSTEECLRSMKKELPNFNKLDKIKVVVFYLYDICDKKSYDYILGLTGGFQEACEKNGYNADISNYVIGNKIDLEYWRQVKVSAGLELSKKVSSSTSKAATSAFIIAIDDGGAKFDTSVYDYFEISAFTGQHIDYLSDIIMRTMLSKDVLKRIRATVRYALSSGSDTERSVSESGRGVPTADMLLRKKKNVSSVSEPPADADDDAFMSELKALDEALDEVGASVKREIKSQNELLSDIGGSTDQTDNFASYDRLKRNARVKGQRGGILQLSGSLDGSRGRGELVRARQRSQAQPREPPRAWDHAPAAQPLQREMMLEPTHPDYPIAPSGGGPGIPLPPPPPAPAPVAGAPRAVDGFNFADAENELNMELAELKVSLKIDSKGMEAMQKETDLEEAGEDDKWELDELENAISEGEEESSDDEEKLVPVPALKTTKKKFMPTEEQKSQETQPIVKTIIEPVIVISEKFERIAADSDRLSLEAAQYKKKSSGLVSVKVLCCCCCIIISRCMQQVYSSSVSACVTVGNWCKSFVPKKGLFDNVLADTENAFQTLAKCLKYLTDTTSLLKHPEQWNDLLLLCVAPLVYIMDTTLEVFYIGLSYVVVILSTVALILPSFFTLLIVRTNVVEKESKAFGGNMFSFFFLDNSL